MSPPPFLASQSLKLIQKISTLIVFAELIVNGDYIWGFLLVEALVIPFDTLSILAPPLFFWPIFLVLSVCLPSHVRCSVFICYSMYHNMSFTMNGTFAAYYVFAPS
jgi:hypothetical protein